MVSTQGANIPEMVHGVEDDMDTRRVRPSIFGRSYKPLDGLDNTELWHDGAQGITKQQSGSESRTRLEQRDEI